MKPIIHSSRFQNLAVVAASRQSAAHFGTESENGGAPPRRRYGAVKGRRFSRIAAAFTRLDLLAILAGVAIMGLVALPLMAGSKPRGERVACLNNLRQLGVAWNLWAGEHGNRYPWRTSLANGGTSMHPLMNNPWLHFSWISNELRTPKVLTCPSDTPRRTAADFSAEPDKGLLNGSIRNDCLSYFIGLDSLAEWPMHWLSGDRNVRFASFSACSSGARFAASFAISRATQTVVAPVDAGWTNNMHGNSGNVLFTDGRVEELSNDGFRKSIIHNDDNNSVHLLIP
jgi:prepilin-type processing-associated H-X9-DG protein